VLIAAGIAALGVPFRAAAAVKATATQQMKNVPLHERAPLLSAAIQAGTDAVQGRRVLLVDDLWETASTLRRVAEVLGQMGYRGPSAGDDPNEMSRPSTVFVAGSRQISRLPAEVRSRLDTMIEKGFQILVGDANGADKAVQRYLADKSYPNVLVHCMKDHCRNNVGSWPRVRSMPLAAPKASTTTP
jgi:hypothetical protein